jgi:hypothetical protein
MNEIHCFARLRGSRSATAAAEGHDLCNTVYGEQTMFDPHETLTRQEVTEQLQAEGLQPGTDEFHAAIRNRFVYAEMHRHNPRSTQREPLYVEVLDRQATTSGATGKAG